MPVHDIESIFLSSDLVELIRNSSNIRINRERRFCNRVNKYCRQFIIWYNNMVYQNIQIKIAYYKINPKLSNDM